MRVARDELKGVVGSAVFTSRCGFKGPGSPTACSQPIALVLGPTDIRYAFPPDWGAIDTLTPEQLLEQYGEGKGR